MVTISRSRSAPREGGVACLALARGLVRDREVRGLVGLRVVGTEALLSLSRYTVPERREDAERGDAQTDAFLRGAADQRYQCVSATQRLTSHLLTQQSL